MHGFSIVSWQVNPGLRETRTSGRYSTPCSSLDNYPKTGFHQALPTWTPHWHPPKTSSADKSQHGVPWTLLSLYLVSQSSLWTEITLWFCSYAGQPMVSHAISWHCKPGCDHSYHLFLKRHERSRAHRTPGTDTVICGSCFNKYFLMDPPLSLDSQK